MFWLNMKTVRGQKEKKGTYSIMYNIHQLAYDWSSLFLYVDVHAVLLRLQALNILSLIFIKKYLIVRAGSKLHLYFLQKEKKNCSYKIILSIHSRNQSYKKVFYVPMSHKGAFTHLAINTFIRLKPCRNLSSQQQLWPRAFALWVWLTETVLGVQSPYGAVVFMHAFRRVSILGVLTFFSPVSVVLLPPH